jgi:hypothetical protein
VIVVHLTGGLGNEMFQYATGRALAARQGAELVLDPSWFEGRGGGEVGFIRRYELGCFDLDVRVAPVDEVARFPRSRIEAGVRRVLPRGRRPMLRVVEEPPLGALLTEIVEAPDNTYIRGYWQNPSYFADAEPLLRHDFSFKREAVERGAETARQIEASTLPTLAVHVRRGTYLSDPGIRERLGALGEDYYRRAVDIVSGDVGDVRVFVFSDDPVWCRARLALAHDTTVIGGEKDTWPTIMHLMSLCDHNVIANSSFSWWGAWLNANPDKIVVAPRPWLLDPRWDDEHRVPREWIRIHRDGHHADQPPSTTTFAPVT